MFLGEAAALGSKSACYHLGLYYAKGRNGFPKDLKMARRYYSMKLDGGDRLRQGSRCYCYR